MHRTSKGSSLLAGIALAVAAQAQPSQAPTAPDQDRMAIFRSLTQMAGRVMDTEQLVMATHGACLEHLPPIDALPPAYARWLNDSGTRFAKAHRILTVGFAQRMLGDRLAKDPAAASIMRSLPQMQIDGYQRGLAAARATDCATFTQQLGTGKFDYARQTPQAFRIIERLDLGKPETYTMASLLALAK